MSGTLSATVGACQVGRTMDTVKKGDSFEARVHEALRDLLENDGLGLAPRNCRLFSKKAYYSRDREAEIVVDLSIEVWLPDAPQYSLLWVCECKDYSSAVPVGDVEEFAAKLQQIAGANVKGMMAISGAMQQSAFNYARSRGIAVVRLLPKDQVEWLIHMVTMAMERAKLDPREFTSAFLDPGHRGKNRDFYGLCDDYMFDGWYPLMKRMLSA